MQRIPLVGAVLVALTATIGNLSLANAQENAITTTTTAAATAAAAAAVNAQDGSGRVQAADARCVSCPLTTTCGTCPDHLVCIIIPGNCHVCPNAVCVPPGTTNGVLPWNAVHNTPWNGGGHAGWGAGHNPWGGDGHAGWGAGHNPWGDGHNPWGGLNPWWPHHNHHGNWPWDGVAGGGINPFETGDFYGGLDPFDSGLDDYTSKKKKKTTADEEQQQPAADT
ncbi:hypothetical protein SYNPS1DRAFT_27529 [Syncephalis pseudoplumigaleata]|uniref:Membrane anchor Opy2 N-terminal domain-containing protein n=1 Tax=Syncephalis pseudoplumigaleata TaxID=1712513 RepID=A0A4P9Z418_9FUNG|nr:hypothetical protein SYNPS1DRAFT_27529 [Syncephalis pseudoplumigaleata]|eukprot:RKP26792.1 hypothetical protein SYNPS1DRAFT_27529 [Syncephalis pseudoplumigaleata]